MSAWELVNFAAMTLGYISLLGVLMCAGVAAHYAHEQRQDRRRVAAHEAQCTICQRRSGAAS